MVVVRVGFRRRRRTGREEVDEIGEKEEFERGSRERIERERVEREENGTEGAHLLVSGAETAGGAPI